MSNWRGRTPPGLRALGLSRRDIFAQGLSFAIERVDVALDHVADGDDADQPAGLHDRNMAKPARRHCLPYVINGVVTGRGDDLRRHVTRHRIIERGGAMFGEDPHHVAFRKDAQNAERSVRYDHRSHTSFGQELYDFLQGAMRLSGENVAPLFVENPGNCHRSLPYSP